MTAQTELDMDLRDWRAPQWAYSLGYASRSQVLKLVNIHAGLIRRARLDGIEHVAPILLALRCNPEEAKRRVGKSAWKQIHHSPLELNVARANILLKTRIRIADLLAFPKGALREVVSKASVTSEAAVTAAGLIAKTRAEFREAVMLAHDTTRMGGTIDTSWSLRRLREEHDRRAMEWARAKSDPTPWREPFAATQDGYTFTMLNSAADFAVEGRAQRHCVASYAADAKRGRCIVFRIEGPERATVRFGGHPVRVQEVKARFNAPVSEACRRACAKVCAEHMESVKKGKA
jgi:hypothetical protein